MSVSVCVRVQRECEGALEIERMHVLRAGLGVRAWAWARECERGLRPAPAATQSETPPHLIGRERERDKECESGCGRGRVSVSGQEHVREHDRDDECDD